MIVLIILVSLLIGGFLGWKLNDFFKGGCI